MSELFKKGASSPTLEWAWRGGIAIFMVFQLYLSNHYVSKEDYETQDVRVRKIEDCLIQLQDNQAQIREMRDKLDTVDLRLRSVETHLAVLDYRPERSKQNQ